MRLAFIKNSYMYKCFGNEANGKHPYLISYDRKNKRYKAIQVTHLYNRDLKRFMALKKGLLMKYKLKGFDTPSGIRNEYYYKNVNGDKINIKDKRNVQITSVSLGSADCKKILNFAKNPKR